MKSKMINAYFNLLPRPLLMKIDPWCANYANPHYFFVLRIIRKLSNPLFLKVYLLLPFNLRKPAIKFKRVIITISRTKFLRELYLKSFFVCLGAQVCENLDQV